MREDERQVPELLIVGASVRAALQSAARAGIRVAGADLFADRDSLLAAQVTRVDRYPDDLAQVVRQIRPGCVMYTGALENHPQVVAEMAALAEIAGNESRVLATCRDPAIVRAAFDGLPGVCVPQLTLTPPQSGAGEWLRKPFRSAGGHDVVHWKQSGAKGLEVAPGELPDALSNGAAQPFYWQQLVVGTPRSAAFLASQHETRLLGCCRQLVGCNWLGAGGYAYCGSIETFPVQTRFDRSADVQPLADSDAHDERAVDSDRTSTSGRAAAMLPIWRSLGNAAVKRFELRGLFGIDVIDDGRQLWPLEINPRYTASMELYERAVVGGFAETAWPLSLVAQHLRACREITLPSIPHEFEYVQPCWRAKAILFAKRPICVSATLSDRLLSFADSSNIRCHAGGGHRENRMVHDAVLADIPQSGISIEPQQPVLTILLPAANALSSPLTDVETVTADEHAIRDVVCCVEELLYA